MDNTEKNSLYSYICDRINILLFMKLLFFIVILLNITINLSYLGNAILDQHGFRQTQTAITSFYLKLNGFSLNYETPVLGFPWSIPFEFPIYQEIVALASKICDIPLTQLGKLINLLFTLGCIFPIYKALKIQGIESVKIYFILSLIYSSPIYIFWGGTFMIEGAALFFTCMFFYYSLLLFNREWSGKNILLASLFLLLGSLQKITTVLPNFLFLFILISLFSIKTSDLKINKKKIVAIAIAFILPMILGIIWVKYTDYIKGLNPIGKGMTSNALQEWNYGTLSQRESIKLWYEVIYDRNIKTISLYFFGLVFCLYSLALSIPKKHKITIACSIVLFISPFLIFTNLHWTHNYYQFANSFFLSIAVGLSIFNVFESLCSKRALPIVLIATLFIVSNFSFFYRDYYVSKSYILTPENKGILQMARYIRLNTPPDSRLVIFGHDWSSEIAFYSERRALTLPLGNWDIEAINNPNSFFEDTKTPNYLLCPVPNIDDLKKAIEKKYPNATSINVANCTLYIN